MDIKIKKVLITEEEIKKRVGELGAQITKDYKDKNLVLLCILKGSIVFTADLMRQIKLPLTVECIRAKSYVGTHTTGKVSVDEGIPTYLEDKDILIVEDIIDSGLTLAKLKEYLGSKNTASVKICTMLYKKESVINGLVPDYYGFEIAPEFAVGYGLDYDGYFRNIPYIAVPDL